MGPDWGFDCRNQKSPMSNPGHDHTNRQPDRKDTCPNYGSNTKIRTIV